MDILKMEFPMALSIINMKLRDRYRNLETLCEDMDISIDKLRDFFSENGYIYREENNQFIAA